jgi:hypothetical protein
VTYSARHTRRHRQILTPHTHKHESHAVVQGSEPRSGCRALGNAAGKRLSAAANNLRSGMLVTAVALTLLVAQAASAGDGTAVRTAAELVAALASTTTKLVLLAEPLIQLTDANFQNVVHIERNVTLRSAPWLPQQAAVYLGAFGKVRNGCMCTSGRALPLPKVRLCSRIATRSQ